MLAVSRVWSKPREQLRDDSRLRWEVGSTPPKDSAEKAVRDIRRKSSAEEKLGIMLEGLRGEQSIASQ